MVDAAQPLDTRAARFMTWFALIVVLGTDVAYIMLIREQGGVNARLTYHTGSCGSSAIDSSGNVTHPAC